MDEAYEYYLTMDQHCKEMEAELKESQNQHEAVGDAKEQELVKMKDEHQCAIAVLEDIHKKEMDSKKPEIEQVTELFLIKDEELEAANRKAAEDLKNVVKTAESNRTAWKKERKDLEWLLAQTHADSKDALLAQEDEIERLTKAKGRMEKEIKLLSGSIKATYGGDHIRLGADESRLMRHELDKMRERNEILEEKIENTLESMQQDMDHWEAEHREEQQAQLLVRDLQRQVNHLEEALDRREEVIRNMQQGVREQGESGLTHQDSAISQLISKNDGLLQRIDTLEEEKPNVQSQANELDDDNLDQMIRIGEMEELIRDRERGIERSATIRASAETEIKFYENAHRNGNSFSNKEERRLRKYLRKNTKDIQDATSHAAELAAELERYREFVTTVEDKADTEISKMKQQVDLLSLCITTKLSQRTRAYTKRS